MILTRPRRRAFLLLGLLLGVTLCGLFGYLLLDALGPGALRADVAEVLQSPDRAPPKLRCQMVSRTRTGYCLTTLDQPALAQIARQLQLTQIFPSDEAPLALPPMGPGGCRDRAEFGAGAGLSLYWVGGRPAQLALQSGGQFEYLLLIRSETGQACVEVAYAYG